MFFFCWCFWCCYENSWDFVLTFRPSRTSFAKSSRTSGSSRRRWYWSRTTKTSCSQWLNSKTNRSVLKFTVRRWPRKKKVFFIKIFIDLALKLNLKYFILHFNYNYFSTLILTRIPIFPIQVAKAEEQQHIDLKVTSKKIRAEQVNLCSTSITLT